MALGSHEEALAEEPARAEGDLRLQDVVTGAERVALRIEEGQHALPLIVAQELPAHRYGGKAEPAHHHELPDLHPGQKEHGGPDQEQHAGGAEIGLQQHERRRREDERHRQQERQRPADGGEIEPVEIARQRQHQRDLHDLGGLDLDETEIDPALRAHADLALDLDEDQQEKAEQIEKIGVAQPELEVEDRDHQHQQQPGGEARHLARHPGIDIAVGRGIEHREADAGDHRQEQDEPPAYAAQLLAEGLVLRATGGADGLAGEHEPVGHPTSLCARVASGRRRTGSRSCASSRTSRAIGPATAEPPPPCSITTDTA